MQIIAIVESDERGPVAITDPEQITISKFDDFYLAASRCSFSGTPITCEISEEEAFKLIHKGVRCLSLSSDRIDLNKEIE
jgi:hypothetical protein